MSAVQDKAFALIDGWRDEMLSFWEKFVNMESASPAKEDVDKVAAFLEQTLTQFGGKAEIIPFAEAGNGVQAVFGDVTDKAPICFLGHFDTVFPKGAVVARPFKVEDGKAYGPGVLDMKGGITIQMFAARALKEAGYTDRQIKIVLAGDEETMHPKSTMAQEFVERSRGSLAAFNFETGDINDSLVVGRKGVVLYKIIVKGVAVHAGREPQNGRSAIKEIAHKLLDVEALSNYDDGLSLNVGLIKGGVVVNSVPDYAEIDIDVRVLRNDQIAYVDEKLKEVCAKTYIDGTTTILEKKVGGFAPMEKTEGNERLYAHVKATAEKIGLKVTNAIVSGGASDSAYSVIAGVPTIDQMGAKGQWNHADREYAMVESLYERTKLTVASVLDIEAFAKGS